MAKNGDTFRLAWHEQNLSECTGCNQANSAGSYRPTTVTVSPSPSPRSGSENVEYDAPQLNDEGEERRQVEVDRLRRERDALVAAQRHKHQQRRGLILCAEALSSLIRHTNDAKSDLLAAIDTAAAERAVSALAVGSAAHGRSVPLASPRSKPLPPLRARMDAAKAVAHSPLEGLASLKRSFEDLVAAGGTRPGWLEVGSDVDLLPLSAHSWAPVKLRHRENPLVANGRGRNPGLAAQAMESPPSSCRADTLAATWAGPITAVQVATSGPVVSATSACLLATPRHDVIREELQATMEATALAVRRTQVARVPSLGVRHHGSPRATSADRSAQCSPTASRILVDQIDAASTARGFAKTAMTAVPSENAIEALRRRTEQRLTVEDWAGAAEAFAHHISAASAALSAVVAGMGSPAPSRETSAEPCPHAPRNIPYLQAPAATSSSPRGRPSKSECLSPASSVSTVASRSTKSQDLSVATSHSLRSTSSASATLPITLEHHIALSQDLSPGELSVTNDVSASRTSPPVEVVSKESPTLLGSEAVGRPTIRGRQSSSPNRSTVLTTSPEGDRRVVHVLRMTPERDRRVRCGFEQRTTPSCSKRWTLTSTPERDRLAAFGLGVKPALGSSRILTPERNRNVIFGLGAKAVPRSSRLTPERDRQEALGLGAKTPQSLSRPIRTSERVLDAATEAKLSPRLVAAESPSPRVRCRGDRIPQVSTATTPAQKDRGTSSRPPPSPERDRRASFGLGTTPSSSRALPTTPERDRRAAFGLGHRVRVIDVPGSSVLRRDAASAGQPARAQRSPRGTPRPVVTQTPLSPDPHSSVCRLGAGVDTLHQGGASPRNALPRSPVLSVACATNSDSSSH